MLNEFLKKMKKITTKYKFIKGTKGNAFDACQKST